MHNLTTVRVYFKTQITLPAESRLEYKASVLKHFTESLDILLRASYVNCFWTEFKKHSRNWIVSFYVSMIASKIS